MMNKWHTLIEEGDFTLQFKVDESELIILKGENTKYPENTSLIHLYLEDLEKLHNEVYEIVEGSM